MGIIRFILAITVVIAHSNALFGFTFVGGQLAVQAFFIVSGFYMTLILNEKYIGINSSYKLFITNRFLRLYPIYWTVLLCSFFYSFIDPLNSNGDEYAALSYYIKYFKNLNASSLFFLLFTNVSLFLQDFVMFLGVNTSDGSLFFTPNFRNTNPELYHFLFVPQAWTIGIEIAFYLIAPFIVRRNVKVICVLIFISLLLRFFLSRNGLSNDPWSYRFFPTELAFFLLGSVSYHIYIRVRNMNLPNVYLIVSWVLLLSFTISYSFLQIPGKRFIYLFVFFICLPFIFSLTKSWKKDRYIGDLSYPIYISHLFVLSCITELNFVKSNRSGMILSILTIVFSVGLNELLIKGIEKKRQRRIVAVL